MGMKYELDRLPLTVESYPPSMDPGVRQAPRVAPIPIMSTPRRPGRDMPQRREAFIACAILAMTWWCPALHAEELSEREFLSEFPLVLSASRLRQNVMDAPQSVTVIDQ